MDRRSAITLSALALGEVISSGTAAGQEKAGRPATVTAADYKAQALALFMLIKNRSYLTDILNDDGTQSFPANHPFYRFKTSSDANSVKLYQQTRVYLQTFDATLLSATMVFVGTLMQGVGNAGLSGIVAKYSNPDDCPCQYKQKCVTDVFLP